MLTEQEIKWVSDESIRNNAPPSSELDRAKSQLDYIFAHHLQGIYYKIRDSEHKPSKKHLNRAGKKLEECLDLLPELQSGGSFLDLCAGPGAWSYLLSGRGYSGRGVTIASDIKWHEKIKNLKSYSVVSPEDGDVMKKSVRDECKEGGKVDLVVADGGISSGEDDNHQEIKVSKLKYAEFTLALECLSVRGNLVLKLFDTFHEHTQNLIFSAAYLFRECYIVKPATSRSVNSERYLVGLGYRDIPERYQSSADLLEGTLHNLFETWQDEKKPGRVYEYQHLRPFCDSLYRSVREMERHQISALDSTCRRVYLCVANGTLQEEKKLSKSTRARRKGFFSNKHRHDKKETK